MTKFKTYYLYFTVFVTGAAVLIIEILGTRVLAPFYGSTIFVWSSLISVALGFLALGYWLGGLLVDRRPDFKIFYGNVFAAGILLLLAIKLNQPILLLSDKFGLQFGPLIASFILFSLPFLFLGSLTPFAIRLRTYLAEKVGFRSGSIFAIATMGSLIGGLLSGFVLIPILPISQIFYMVSGLLVGVALVGLVLHRSRGRRGATIILVFILVLLGAAFFPFVKDMSRSVTEILYHTNTFYGDIKITGSYSKPCLYVNGSSQTCIDLADPLTPRGLFAKQAVALINLLPEGSRTLLLGLGGGAIMAAAPKHTFIDAVEIDPRVVEFAKEYFGVVSRERQKIFVDDARRFVRKSPTETYDLIIEDIALGAHLPAYIFTKESFQEMKRVLKPGGLLEINLNIGSESESDQFAEALVKTAQAVFTSVDVYSSHPSLFSNLVLYLYDEPSPLSGKAQFYHRYEKITQEQAKVVTDDYNRLEAYYILHAFANLKNARRIGSPILFSN